MSRVIQLISHNQHLFALTDDGEIYQHRQSQFPCDDKWSLFEGPIPLRFSLPEEYEAPVASAKPQPRRPTSIGSDGNYVPVVDHRHYLD